MDARPADSHTDTSTPLRCVRCGIESAERSCFIIPERFSKPPHDIRCITCERRRVIPSTGGNVVALIFALLWPLLFLVAGSKPGSNGSISLFAIGLTALVYPAAILAHELGHALVASLLRLEFCGLEIGYGRVVWQFQIRGARVQLHVWPLCGCVYLGSKSMRWLRTRLWIATLSGPLTNALLVAVTAVYWEKLEPGLGSVALGLCLIVNVLLAFGSLVPYRTVQFGRSHRSDGLALLEIPRTTAAQLKPYLTSIPLLRARHRYEADDYAGAKVMTEETLVRTPDDLAAQTILAASLIGLDQYAAASARLTTISDALTEQPPADRAMIRNALAVALLLENVLDPLKQSELIRAEPLSREAYDIYPCVLEYRSTRALVLVATGSPETALTLLEYAHYDTGTPRQRGHREVTRAFAFQKLERQTEANRSAALALQLDPKNVKMFRSLGLSYSPTEGLTKTQLGVSP
jgi:hypothetical protein